MSLRRLIKRHKARCHYCNVPTDNSRPPGPKSPTRDHKHPMSRGGARYGPNVVLSCYACNNLKGNLTDEEFVLYRGYLARGIPKREARRLAKREASSIGIGPISIPPVLAALVAAEVVKVAIAHAVKGTRGESGALLGHLLRMDAGLVDRLRAQP